jgi:hypothetical protein
MDGGKSGNVFENPPRKWYLIQILFICLFATVLIILIFSDMMIISLSILLFSTVAIIFWAREYPLKPSKITILETGISLLYRNGKEKQILWKDIGHIEYSKWNKNTKTGRMFTGGALRIKGSPVVINITSESAKAIQQHLNRI